MKKVLSWILVLSLLIGTVSGLTLVSASAETFPMYYVDITSGEAVYDGTYANAENAVLLEENSASLKEKAGKYGACYDAGETVRALYRVDLTDFVADAGKAVSIFVYYSIGNRDWSCVVIGKGSCNLLDGAELAGYRTKAYDGGCYKGACVDANTWGWASASSNDITAYSNNVVCFGGNTAGYLSIGKVLVVPAAQGEMMQAYLDLESLIAKASVMPENTKLTAAINAAKATVDEGMDAISAETITVRDALADEMKAAEEAAKTLAFVDYSKYDGTGSTSVTIHNMDLAMTDYFTAKKLDDGSYAAGEKSTDWTYWCLRFSGKDSFLKYEDGSAYRSAYTVTVEYYDPGTVTTALDFQYRTAEDENTLLSKAYVVDVNKTADTAGWKTAVFTLTDIALENNAGLYWYSCRFRVANNADCGYMIKRVEFRALDGYKGELGELLGDLPSYEGRESEFTADQMARYDEAVAAAEALYEDDTAKQPAIDAAVEALKAILDEMFDTYAPFVDYSNWDGSGSPEMDGTFVSAVLTDTMKSVKLEDGSYAAGEKNGDWTYWTLKFNPKPAQYADGSYRTAYKFTITYYDSGKVTTPLDFQYRTADDVQGLSLLYTVDKNVEPEEPGWRTKTFVLTDAHLENSDYLVWYSCRFRVAAAADCGYMIKRITIRPLDNWKGDLQTLINSLPALDSDESVYDAQDLAAFKETLAKAQQIMDDATVKQDAVNTVLAELESARDNLFGAEYGFVDFTSGEAVSDDNNWVTVKSYESGELVSCPHNDASAVLCGKDAGYLTLDLSAFAEDNGSAVSVLVQYYAAPSEEEIRWETMVAGINHNAEIGQNQYYRQRAANSNGSGWRGELTLGEWAWAQFDFKNISSGTYDNKLVLGGYGSNMYIAKVVVCTTDTKSIVCRTLGIDTAPDEAWLPTLFADNMLFQQKKPMNIWGYGQAGSTTTAKLYNGDTLLETVSAVTDADGKWELSFSARDGGYTAYDIEILNNNAAIKAIKNVVVGEMWVAGGQSNMELMVKTDADAADLLMDLSRPNLRIFWMYLRPQGDAAFDIDPIYKDIPTGVWSSGTDVSVVTKMSSLAYQFAAKLQDELDMPVGICDTSLGATIIETWLGREAIEGDAAVKAAMQAKGTYDDGTKTGRSTNSMSAMYNQKIAPLAGMNVAGVIWYQGESNSDWADIYDIELDLLKRSWGKIFGYENGDMPFIFTQVAPYLLGSSSSNPQYPGWLHEAFERGWALSRDKNTAMVTIYDLPLVHMRGNESSDPIHPRKKGPVAERFATAALNMLYGGDDVYTAPVMKSMEIRDGAIYITFDNVGKGLTSVDGTSALHGFAIAGEDKIFVNAQATVVNADTVKVWSDRVVAPKNVTYAFSAMNTSSNLCNSAGIPASPFRTMEVNDTTAKPDTSYKYFTEQGWMYCDEDEWVYDGTYSVEKCYAFRPSFKVNGATYTYSNDVKVEGTASLKVEHTAEATVSPILTYESLKQNWNQYNYLSVKMLNAGETDITVKLVVRTSKGGVAVPAVDGKDSVVLAAGSSFETVTFDLAAAEISGNITGMDFRLTAEEDGTVYFDEFAVGMTEEAEKALSAIAVTKQPTVLEYTVGDTLDTTGMELTLTYSDNTTEVVSAGWGVEYDFSKAGEQQVTVSYAGKTCTFTVNVQADTLFGDVDGNGKIDSTDARMTLQYFVGSLKESDLSLDAADVDGNGKVDSTDARLILQYFVGTVTEFPVSK